MAAVRLKLMQNSCMTPEMDAKGLHNATKGMKMDSYTTSSLKYIFGIWYLPRFLQLS